MSSFKHQRLLSSPLRPSTPGFHLTQSTSPSHHSVSDAYEDDSLPPPANLDLTNVSTTYDSWTELQQVPSSDRGETTTQKLLRGRVSRTSSVSSLASAASDAPQSKTSQWLDSMSMRKALFCQLPVIRHILWPLQRLNRRITHLMSRSRFHGWRMGVILGSCVSSLVLCCNITILVVGGKRNGGFRNGFAIPLIGEANDMSWWSSAFHIYINALSTLLLAASNYTMQVLGSPTRKEVDRAHASNQWLDIGVLSMRNLSRISRRRLCLVVVLGLSSIPVHLFYNSAIFYIGANNQYNVYVLQTGSNAYKGIYEQSNAPNSVSRANSSYTLIDNSEWARTYDTKFVSYGDLYLAVDDYASRLANTTLDGYIDGWPNVEERVVWSLNESLIYDIPGSEQSVQNFTSTGATSRNWIRFNLAVNLSSSRNITLKDPPMFAHVTHGFAKQVDTASRIQLSLTSMIIVIVCNAVKLCTMLWVLLAEDADFLVTIGDGAASFLAKPDPTTERMCVLSRKEIIREVSDPHHKMTTPNNDQLAALVKQSSSTWTKQYSKYSTALDRDRVVGSYFIFILIGILFASCLTTVGFFGYAGIGWGTSSSTTFRSTDSSTQSTLFNAWLANAAQIVLSFCYLAVNSECTTMAGAAEWNNLATSPHKGLRVTQPSGKQRDTYFLQLPYRWSLPLTVASGGLHWLLSQSIFLVRIDTYDRNGEYAPELSQSACGFSGMSFMTLTIAFYLVVGVVGLVGHKRITVRTPFAASCSLVMSAACHAPEDDRDTHLKLVQWGVVDDRMYEGKKHCALSSKTVKKPKVGETYL